MIVRARPDVDEGQLNRFINGGYSNEIQSELLFFNSGSNSLEFLLELLGTGKKIGIQVFTCIKVLNTIKRIGDIPVFMDVNTDYFTTTYDIVNEYIERLDILIITHLFGIPNPDYVKIKNMCNKKNVILIDDLTQTFHARILFKGQYRFLEEISDNYFYSFFYDKPISLIRGGALCVQKDLRGMAIEKYRKIPKITENEGVKDLRHLLLLYKLLDPLYYNHDFRTDSLFQDFLFNNYPTDGNIKLLKLLMNHFFNAIISRVGIKKKISNQIMRLSNVQTRYILNRMECFKSSTKTLKNILNYEGIDDPIYLKDNRIECSFGKKILINKTLLKRALFSTEIYLSNFPYLIDDNGEYIKAKNIINNYTNLPLWNPNITKYV